LKIASRLAGERKDVLKKRKKSKDIERKIAFFLENRGFSGDVIYEVLNLED
jgi:SOS response regulatory protein OraA/RecX